MKSQLTKIAEQKTEEKPELLTRGSYRWMQDKINELKRLSNIASSISKEESRNTTQYKIGQMYFFYYDPKTKADLPYYDRFPLVIVLEKYPDGYLGLNLHYLPIKYRVTFLKKLMQYAVYSAENEIKRVRVTYDILNATRRFKEFSPCLKRYLFSHIRSRLLEVKPNEWEVATHLPIHQFKKAQPKEVWEDSVNEIKGS
jgi:hypothetical protein